MGRSDRKIKARELEKLASRLASGASLLYIAERAAVLACCWLIDRSSRAEIRQLATQLAEEIRKHEEKGGDTDVEFLDETPGPTLRPGRDG